MQFEIILTPGANADLAYFKTAEQRLIVKGIKHYLAVDAHIETKKRKQLRANLLAPWELRIDAYRVFYDFEDAGIVKIIAVGIKEHNDLYIRGRRVLL